jgi:hypothetical protein
VGLEVRYSVVGHRRPVQNGSGRTIDISNSGLSFNADRPLSIGQKLDVAIDWSVLLEGDVQLQIVASGMVVRSTEGVTAIRIERLDFRTQGAGPKVVPL